MDTVEFQLKLQDQMTAALKSSADAAEKLQHLLDHTTERLEHLEKEEAHEKKEEEDMFTRAVEKGELLKEAIEKVVEKVEELGKEFVESTIEITDFGLKAEIALNHLNGATEEAEERTGRMLAEARKFADDARLPVESITEAFLGLRRAGLDDSWVRPLTAAASDLAGLSGHPENFRELVDVFAKIGERGEVTSRDLNALRSAGLNVGLMARDLGERDMAELQKKLEHKPLGLYEGLRAIEQTIKETAHEDFLGQVTKEQGETIGGSIQLIKNAYVDMVDSFNSNPAFKEVRTDFAALAEDIVKNLPTWERQFTTAFDPMLRALDAFLKNPDAIKNVFEEALTAVEAISSAASGVIRVIEFITGHKNLIEGVAAGAAGAALAPVIGVGAAGAAAVGGGLGVTFGSQSTAEKAYSEKFGARVPGVPEPFVGHFADGGPVPATGPAVVHENEFVVPEGGALVLRGGGGGGRSIHAPITIHVTIEGGHAAGGLTEHGLSLELNEILPTALVSALEKLAATVGAD